MNTSFPKDLSKIIMAYTPTAKEIWVRNLIDEMPLDTWRQDHDWANTGIRRVVDGERFYINHWHMLAASFGRAHAAAVQMRRTASLEHHSTIFRMTISHKPKYAPSYQSRIVWHEDANFNTRDPQRKKKVEAVLGRLFDTLHRVSRCSYCYALADEAHDMCLRCRKISSKTGCTGCGGILGKMKNGKHRFC